MIDPRAILEFAMRAQGKQVADLRAGMISRTGTSLGKEVARFSIPDGALLMVYRAELDIWHPAGGGSVNEPRPIIYLESEDTNEALRFFPQLIETGERWAFSCQQISLHRVKLKHKTDLTGTFTGLEYRLHYLLATSE